MARQIDYGRDGMVLVSNVSGEDIPGGSFAEITGINDDGITEIDKPSADSLAAAQVVIVPFQSSVPSGQSGWVFPGTMYHVNASYNGTAPAAGDDFGTVANQWYGEKDKTGFKALGASGGYARVSPFRATAQIEELINPGTLVITGVQTSDFCLSGSVDNPILLTSSSYLILIDSISVEFFTDISNAPQLTVTFNVFDEDGLSVGSCTVGQFYNPRVGEARAFVSSSFSINGAISDIGKTITSWSLCLSFSTTSGGTRAQAEIREGVQILRIK